MKNAANSVYLRVLRAHFSPLKCHKPFPATGLHHWPHTVRVPPDPLKSAYSIKCLMKAHVAQLDTSVLNEASFALMR